MIRLRPVGLHDWEFLYDLLEERPLEANISHQVMPDWASHREFIRSEPYKAWYIIELHTDRQQPQQLGSIYLSKQDEIGIAIAKQHQRQGYAKAAIAALMQQHPQPRYLANIAPNNMRSHRLFMELGFNPIQNTLEHRPR